LKVESEALKMRVNRQLAMLELKILRVALL